MNILSQKKRGGGGGSGRPSWDRVRLVITHALISHGTSLSLFK